MGECDRVILNESGYWVKIRNRVFSKKKLGQFWSIRLMRGKFGEISNRRDKISFILTAG